MQASMCELMCLGGPVMPLLCDAAQLPGGLLTLAGPPVPFEGYAGWQLAKLGSLTRFAKSVLLLEGAWTGDVNLPG